MVMKKSSGGDSPLRQGAGNSFWTLPMSRRRKRRLAVCFVEIDWVFLGFPRRGEYIGGRAASGGGPGGHTARGWATPPYGVPSPWSPSVSALDSVSCREK
jgi:hypothetical protein